MGQAIVIHRTGGPDVLSWEAFDPGRPGPEEVRVVHEAIGLNFIDVYHRTGLYPLPSLPAVIGLEGAGRVEELGESVTGLAVGDRVAYAGVPVGAYAQVRCIPAHRLIKLPEQIACRQAAAMMLQGMTARYLLTGCFRVEKGSRILVHAAAGGVGSILSQWAAHRGALVIGTAGSEEKAEFARSNGCSEVILYRTRDVAEAVREITDGKGVDAVYDSVGRDTFLTSLDCLRPMGTMVSFGQSSGPVPPFDPSLLAAKGSLFLTRPSLMHYTAMREDLQAHAADLFDVVDSGAVRITIGQEYPLREAARAHQDLEARRTSGSSLFIP
ncbi:MAG: quinone oxidoreductase [Desulfofustis sp.]|nr:quinone oxidoreductase [Desulfofustis sp.]